MLEIKPEQEFAILTGQAYVTKLLYGFLSKLNAKPAALVYKLKKECDRMFGQLLLGTVITVTSLMVGAIMWGILKSLVERIEPWLRRSEHRFRTFIVVLLIVVVFMMSATTFGVWLWALVFVQMSAFSTLEEAVYYSLVAYTTLGMGDVVVPLHQRLLGGMTGANGFFMFGLMTAMLTDTLRHVDKMHRGMEE